MSSPVNIAFHSFVKIDRSKKDPVYMQIVYQFINAVKTNLLEDGDQLPGSRKIAEDLQVHRKTIMASLVELQEQGWINSIPNIGTFVKNAELSSVAAIGSRAFRSPPEKAAFTFRKQFILDTPLLEHREDLYFTDGTPDYGIIKGEELARFFASVLRKANWFNEFQQATGGNLFFRDQLSYYLNITRGFHLSRKFLLPISGREQVFSILSQLLLKTGDIILVENLSYFLPNMIFGQAGAQLRTIPVDEDGMRVDFIREHFKAGEIRFVYLNPRSQYPTTVPLSEERKTALLQLAEQYNFIVIEDDDDFEFSLPKDRSASLYRKDGGNRVIYIGAFGRFLTPGFQMHLVIAPEDFLEEGKKYLNIFSRPNFLMEKTLGDIIHQGDVHRYQRKFYSVISERKRMFAQLLHTYFKSEITFSVPLSGLAFWVQFNQSFSLSHFQKRARKKGLLIPGICLYQNQNLIALRLGFGHLSKKEMGEAVRLLAEVYGELVSEASLQG